MAEPVALAALALDAAIGWPDALYRRIGHPVGLFARIIGTVERRWNRPQASERARTATGIVLMLLLVGGVAATAWLIQFALMMALGSWAWPFVALLAFPALAQRSLYDHARPIAKALAADDIPAAREAVGRIVGRDTAALDRNGIGRAAIESLAESFCDGVVAPLFWLLLLGLPGVWTYKAINTADSLIGHREERWRAFGWAAARTDDVANLLPARIAGIAICLADLSGWRIMWRDAGKHASPNAGWPEAAMAGALGIRLAGPVTYDGVVHDKMWIGDGMGIAGAVEVWQALAIYRRACVLLWIVAGGVAWLL